MQKLFVRISCLLAFIPALSHAQAASPSSRQPEISTSGRGEVRLAPDYAYVLIGVTTQSRSAVETASENARKVAATISALRAVGLTEQQVRTTGYALTQVYEYPKNSPPKLTGFSARNGIRAEVRRLDDLGKVIDAAISAGATDISSIQFVASSTDSARRAALADAVRQARTDADVMARAAGGSLGRLISMNSGGSYQPAGGQAYLGEVIVTGAAMARSSGPTPIAPGELTVVATVSARWDFVGGPPR
ncbi:MAG TPA: SIMPL domain-containing protein [Gemmatimonadaceae bacterium]|nr:SIMPL domain-containing protein [Gemmatimonadaceae bacterium]